MAFDEEPKRDPHEECANEIHQLQAEVKRLTGNRLSWICAVCGSPVSEDEESLDSGTTLLCKSCGGETIVELHTIASYKERHDTKLQNSACRDVVEWIASKTNLFFAECSDAEEVVMRCKKALEIGAGKSAKPDEPCTCTGMPCPIHGLLQ